jgi:hypothetical protein
MDDEERSLPNGVMWIFFVKEKCILGSIRKDGFSNELSHEPKPQDAPQDYLQSRYGLQAVCRGAS